MGRQSELKDLRKQLREVVKELMPEIMASELQASVNKKLSEDLKVVMGGIEEHVKKTMHEMNERQKDTLGYLVRQTTAPVVETLSVPKEEQKSE